MREMDLIRSNNLIDMRAIQISYLNEMRVIVLFLLFLPLSLFAQKISPLDYGLAQAKTGIERYRILLTTHKLALEKGLTVDYTGIKELDIEIPIDGCSIPLGYNTDFKGLILNVTNKRKNIYLFKMNQNLIPISISKQEFCSLSYLHREEFKYGDKLLVIEDKTTWVKNRIGYAYGAMRKDVLLISDAKVVNSPVASYNTLASQPQFKYCSVDQNEKIIDGITINRMESSTCMTRCFLIENQNRVTISNVIINTPVNALYGDAAISLQNCTNSLLKDIVINGTYSQLKRYGYGIMFNNLWNTTILRLKGDGKWGIFGNNNVNVAHLKDCCINRFDIHCYGRDIDFENCTIFRLYNQYSSIYGKISYRNCVFDAAIPCLLTSSYNAYTPFDLFFENCIMKMTSLNDGIIYIMGIPKQENERFELAKKCLPNIKIDNCQIEFKEPLKECYIFKSDTQRLPISFGYISQIVLNKIDISSDAVVCKISNIDLFTDDVIDYKMEKLSTKGSNKISPIVVQSGK